MSGCKEESNPFLGKFPRIKNKSNAWVSVGEGGCSTLDVLLELKKDDFIAELMEALAEILDLSSKNEKLLFGFVLATANKFDIRGEPVYLDLSRAQKYALARGRAISKSTFQRCLKNFSGAGLIAPSGKKAWFYLNPDIFGLTKEFSVRVKYKIRQEEKKCDQTQDFFAGKECVLVPKG